MAANPALFTGVAPFSQAPTSADIALTEFNMKFQEVWGSTPPAWASNAEIGDYAPSDALKARYPIPLDQSGFVSFDGTIPARTLGLRHLELAQSEWADGVQDKASNIEHGDFNGFMKQPAVMAANGKWAPNLWVAEDLDAGETIASWDSPNWQPGHLNSDGSLGSGSVAFFDAAHPANPFGQPMNGAPTTWSNLLASAPLALEPFRTAKSMLRGMRKPNGQNLGLMATHLVVHPDQEEIAKGILDKDFIKDDGVMQSNIQKGIVRLIVAPELVTSGDWYMIAANKPLIRPWMLQMAMGGVPELLIKDKSSDFYKDSLMVKFGAVLRGTRRLVWPHCIIKGRHS